MPSCGVVVIALDPSCGHRFFPYPSRGLLIQAVALQAARATAPVAMRFAPIPFARSNAPSNDDRRRVILRIALGAIPWLYLTATFSRGCLLQLKVVQVSPVAHRALSGLGVGVAGQPACLTGPDDGRRAPPLWVEPPRRPEIASRLEAPPEPRICSY